LIDITILSLFFIFAISLHNAEEALWLPQWSRHAQRFQKPVARDEFLFAVIVITLLAYLAAGLFILAPDIPVFKYMFLGFVGAMIVNVIVIHLLSTIIVRKYSPGLITGIFLLVPLDSLILLDAIDIGVISIYMVIISTAVMAVLLVALIPVLFKLGRILIDYN
jgi:hypothetical protein